MESKALALDIAELKGAKAEALDSIISDNLCFSTYRGSRKDWFEVILGFNPFLYTILVVIVYPTEIDLKRIFMRITNQ